MLWCRVFESGVLTLFLLLNMQCFLFCFVLFFTWCNALALSLFMENFVLLYTVKEKHISQEEEQLHHCPSF